MNDVKPIAVPVTIEGLMSEWSKDCVIDETDAHRELTNIPKLHSKYLNVLIHHTLLSKKAKANYYKRRNFKYQYYSGDLNNPEDLKQYNLQPFTKRVLKTEINEWLDSDDDLNELLLKKAVHEEIVNYCTYVLKEISARTWQIREYLQHDRYLGGM